MCRTQCPTSWNSCQDPGMIWKDHLTAIKAILEGICQTFPEASKSFNAKIINIPELPTGSPCLSKILKRLPSFLAL